MRAGGAVGSVRVRECECAAPLPGIPPQPGQRGAFPRGEPRVTADPRSPSPLNFWSFWARSLGRWGVQGILKEPCQRGGRGSAEYGGSSGPSFAENRPPAWLGSAPSLFPLPARRGIMHLDSLVLGSFEVGLYKNPIVARMMACGHGPSAFSKLLAFCSRWLRLTGLNHQNEES